MKDAIKEFDAYREKMNAAILSAQGNTVIKRIFSADTLAYKDGFLDSRTKEMLGLVASLVLRCDDCIKYHLGTCYKQGVKKEEIFEILGIACLVGGTIVIPATRRAVEYWQALEAQTEEK